MLKPIVAAVALVLALAGCGLLPTGRTEKVTVDHVVAPGGTAASSGDGPVAGVLREAWNVESVKVEDGKMPAVLVTEGRVLVVSPAGVVAHDAGSGAQAWHYREPGRRVLGFAVTGGAVVLTSSDGESWASAMLDSDERRVVGLEVATGKLLWELSPRWSLPFNTASSTHRYAVGSGIALAAGRGDEIVGVDARTGKSRWITELPVGSEACLLNVAPMSSSDGSLALVEENCPNVPGIRYHALDPATGQELWSQVVLLRGTLKIPTVISSAAGVTAFSDTIEHTSIVLGRDGKPMTTFDRLGKCTACTLTAAGTRIAWPYIAQGRHRLALVDAGSGTVEQLDGFKTNNETISDGKRIYGLTQGYSKPGVPSVWAGVADPASGQARRMPMPISMGEGVPEDVMALAGAAGERLILTRGNLKANEAIKLVAFDTTPASGPEELGGVELSAWPDCMALLAAVSGKRGRHLRDHKSLLETATIGRIQLPRHRCTARIERVGDLDVQVLWVAADQRTADALLDGKPGDGPDEVIVSGAERVIRVGSVLVSLSVTAGGSDTTMAAQEIASWLRANT